MARTRLPRRKRVAAGLAVIAVSAATAALVGAAGAADAHLPQSEQYTLPECPTDWEYLPKDLGGRVSESGFPLVGPITDVPEFHDCQRFILEGGARFGPLVTIFASYELDSLEEHLSIVESGQNARTRSDRLTGAALEGRTSLAAALILNLDSAEYQPLGLRRGFSCLYVWRSRETSWREWHASIRFVGANHEACLRPMWPDSLRAGELVVQRDSVRNPGLGVDAYPPVARWDFDRDARRHYIGIKCGHAWCEIGGPGFTPSSRHESAAGELSSGQVRRRIKGWYDEQVLAHPNPLRRELVPSGLIGTVFPDSLLAHQTEASFSGTWVPTAYIALSGRSDYYRSMLNLEPVRPNAPFDQMNRISLCLGTRRSCDIPASDTTTSRCGDDASYTTPRWWARIESAGRRNPPMYRCVRRMDHSDLAKDIPSTTRWRWLANDDTVWQECVKGCCQVLVGDS